MADDNADFVDEGYATLLRQPADAPDSDEEVEPNDRTVHSGFTTPEPWFSSDLTIGLYFCSVIFSFVDLDGDDDLLIRRIFDHASPADQARLSTLPALASGDFIEFAIAAGTEYLHFGDLDTANFRIELERARTLVFSRPNGMEVAQIARAIFRASIALSLSFLHPSVALTRTIREAERTYLANRVATLDHHIAGHVQTLLARNAEIQQFDNVRADMLSRRTQDTNRVTELERQLTLITDTAAQHDLRASAAELQRDTEARRVQMQTVRADRALDLLAVAKKDLTEAERRATEGEDAVLNLITEINELNTQLNGAQSTQTATMKASPSPFHGDRHH